MDVVLVRDVTNLWPSGRCSTASFNTSFTSTTPSCKSESGEYSRKKWKREKNINKWTWKKILEQGMGWKKNPFPNWFHLFLTVSHFMTEWEICHFHCFLKQNKKQIFVNPGFIITFVTFTVCFICFRLSLRSPFLRGWILRWNRGLEI